MSSGSDRAAQRAFALVCHDGRHANSLRQDLLHAHLDFVASHIDRYLVAGPLKPLGLGEHREDTAGSLFVVYAENEQDLVEFMSGDPYYASGMYERVEFYAFQAAAGSAVGGCTWQSEMPPHHRP